VRESRAVLSEFCASVEYYDLWPKRSGWNRLRAIAESVIFPEPFSVIAHRSSEFEEGIRRRLQSGNIDVVHYDTIALTRFLECAPDMPAVLTHHNIESQLMSRRADVERWPARLYLAMQARKLKAYEARMSRRIDVNVMMSNVDEEELKQIAPEIETVVVPNGVDVNYFSPDAESQEPALVYAGGMNMFANRDAVMHFVDQIWPLVSAERSDARFDIIGQDPPPELIARTRKDRGLRIHGYVSDVRPLIRQASVYVVPIRVGGGTRLKVLDALALGKAIISTPVGCEGIEVTHDRDILIEDDPRQFAQQVLELLDDPERRKRLGANARKLAEARYAWAPIAGRLEQAYELAIQRRSGKSAVSMS
jgi:glycosyltransferase involved in cell wall biosynthesis